MVFFVGLKNRYTLGPASLTYSLGLVVAVFFAASVYWTIVGERKYRRKMLAALAVVLAIGTALSLCKVVYLVIYQAAKIDGIRLFETALLIWVGNIVVFAIIYHLIGDSEFTFPRPSGEPADQPMNFLDYFFLSFTTATAFSPTDMSPLTTRARMFMMIEALISLVTLAIAAARAINILPQ